MVAVARTGITIGQKMNTDFGRPKKKLWCELATALPVTLGIRNIFDTCHLRNSQNEINRERRMTMKKQLRFKLTQKI